MPQKTPLCRKGWRIIDVQLDSTITSDAAMIAQFRVVNRYVGNFSSMSVLFPDYPAPVIRNTNGQEMVTMRWGMSPRC